MHALITQWLKHPAMKVVVFLLLLLPALWLLIQIVLLPQQLGADPAKAVVDQTGEWAIQSLWLALTITPLRILTGISQWIRYRRMVGLFAFFYSLLHILAYSVLLIGLDLGQLINDLTQRPLHHCRCHRLCGLSPLSHHLHAVLATHTQTPLGATAPCGLSDCDFGVIAPHMAQKSRFIRLMALFADPCAALWPTHSGKTQKNRLKKHRNG
jgi:hypothetical protein